MHITTPYDLIGLLSYVKNRKRENFGIILLDNDHNLISKKVMFVGTKSNCLVGIRELLVYALKKDASSVVVFHNHPSGNTEPSDLDINTTKDFFEACKLVGIHLLDHIIVGKYDFYSFKEHERMPEDKAKERSVANE